MNNYVRLPLTNIVNCRDIGGYAAKNGKVTRWNKILRSSHLSDSTESEIDYLLDRGVSTVIDLRNHLELERQPNPMMNIKEIEYKHYSLLDQDVINEFYKKQSTNASIQLGDLYHYIIDSHQMVKNIIDQIIKHQDSTILYHCTEGKDRTGVITMMLLGLVGVSKADIIGNYEVSTTYLYESNGSTFSPENKYRLESKRDNMIVAYDYLIDKYGTFEQYFFQLGYSPEVIEELIDSIIE